MLQSSHHVSAKWGVVVPAAPLLLMVDEHSSDVIPLEWFGWEMWWKPNHVIRLDPSRTMDILITWSLGKCLNTTKTYTELQAHNYGWGRNVELLLRAAVVRLNGGRPADWKLVAVLHWLNASRTCVWNGAPPRISLCQIMTTVPGTA
jgi:hypothetical protein